MENPSHPMFKLYNITLQMSLLVFTSALVYFAFVYYPRIINEYKKGNVPPPKSIIAPAVATIGTFPIETENYRIVYGENSDSYYIFVQGKRLDQYVLNRDSATLSLKSVLAKDTLCGLNRIYISVENLDIPDKYNTDPNCP